MAPPILTVGFRQRFSVVGSALFAVLLENLSLIPPVYEINIDSIKMID